MDATGLLHDSTGEMLDLFGKFVRSVPDEEQDGAFRELLFTLSGIYISRGMDEPDWLLEALGREVPTPTDYMHYLYVVFICEAVRLTMRRVAVEHPAGVAGAAREAGVSPATLRRYFAGSFSSPDTWSKLAEYCRGRSEGPPDHGLVGLSLLASTLPMRVRAGARSFLARTLRSYLREHRARTPEWLEEETDWR